MSLVPPITYPLRRVSHLQYQVSCFRRRGSYVVTQTTVILTRLKMRGEICRGTTTGFFGFAGVKEDTEGSGGGSGGPFLVSASTLPSPLTLVALPLDE